MHKFLISDKNYFHPKLIIVIATVFVSCHIKNKNQLIGRWQLIRKSNDHKVIFEFRPRIDSEKFMYWFKDDSTLITQDDDGSKTQSYKYLLSNDKVTLFDSLHSNTFFLKVAEDKLSMKSIYFPFTLELKKIK